MVTCLAIFAACGEKEQEITIQSIAISQPSAELVIGETLNLKATVSPSNATYDGITWTSTKTSVATVSGSGQVSALAEGNTTITAMAGGKTASCSVTVVKGYVAVSSISLNKENLELVEGDTETLAATVSPSDATDKTITWTSSNTSVATVKDGTITAVKEGEATITAKAGEKTASCKVVVAKKVIPVESIELNKTELALVEGDTETLTATITPEDATEKTITWTSSKESVATVKDGVVSAISEGEATITAKAGEKTASCKVVVAKKVIPVEKISLDKDELSLFVGESASLVATVEPDDATDKSVSWSSSDEAVASVDNTGIVSAKAVGDAVITALTGDKSASCTVHITNDPKDEAIVFADNKLKERLVAAFDANKDGELSYNEAAAVTSLEGVLTIKTITSFDEFQFFTGVTTIPDSYFKEWIKLTSIILPPSIINIGHEAFLGCSSLTSIVIPENVTSIGNAAFSSCPSLTSVVIPESVTSIGASAFYECSSLITLSVPEGVKSIKHHTFFGCTGLVSINFPDGLTSIEHHAFCACSSLLSIDIPAGVTNIGERAFQECSSLTSIAVDSNNSVYDSRNNCNAIIETNTNTLLYGCKNTVIPGSVTSIGDRAFWVCYGLTTINIPKSVTSIGVSAFQQCSSLTSIVIPESVTNIGNGAFYLCLSLTSIVIPESVSSIEFATFAECTSLTSVVIPESVIRIGKRAFNGCIKLLSIKLPESVNEIGEEAFNNCSSLISITVKAETPPSAGWGVFSNTNEAPIYVPSGSVDVYKEAYIWKDYADRIQAIQN